MEQVEQVLETFTGSPYAPYLRAALILLAGLIVSRVVKRLVRAQALRSQQLLLVRRFASGIILAVSIGWALSEIGLNLGYVLGAAGVLTIAIGFAAQTSVSNLISGLFLMSERPFVVGDIIKVTDISGEVTAIDLLSVKLRTFDNLLVRIPNESMLKSNVINLTHFPIRRYDMQLSVGYKEDLKRVEEVLREAVKRIPFCLEEPAPIVLFQRFSDSAQDIQFSAWAAQENYVKLRNRLPLEVKRALDKAGIEIPFPQRVLHMVSEAEPRVPKIS